MSTTRCTVLTAHPLRHHFRNSIRGIAASGLDYRVMVPWRLGPTALKLAVKLMPRKESTLRHYAFEEVPAECFHRLTAGPALLAGRAIAPERTVALFDSLCAREIESGQIHCEFLHVFQDFMPQTVKAAARRGSRIITEQILNSSKEVRDLACRITQGAGAKSEDLDFARSEKQNDEVLQLAEVAICPSGFVIDGLAGRFTGRVAHVPYGVDLRMFAPKAKPDPAREFRLVARSVSLRKGLPLALEALVTFATGPRFTGGCGRLVVDFLGDIQDFSFWAPQFERIRGCRGVELTVGNRSRVETIDLLGRAHAFLLPSLSEGMSYAVLEAAAAGAVPVVSPNCGQDGFVDGQHGLVLPFFTPAAITVALERLLTDPSGTEAMRQAAIEWSQSRRWETFEEEIAKLYRELKFSH